MRLLYAASEAIPWIKTGGLADVASGLTKALAEAGLDVRLVLPAYRPVLQQAMGATKIAQLPKSGANVLELREPGSSRRIWFIDIPRYFDRDGNPYVNGEGADWPDNAARFAAFSRALVELALDEAGLGWRPDVLHCNDWQTGLAPVFLGEAVLRPASVFTIHNLAYQGLFPYSDFTLLGLSDAFWNPEALEFYGQVSFMKGGLIYADRITTVSPRYAKEIQTPEFGFGFDGLLRHRSRVLDGILNGIDDRLWDPATDPHIARHYDAGCLDERVVNKTALRKELGLTDGDFPLIGMICRLIGQKGVDLVLAALPEMLKRPIQLVVLGNGARTFEEALLGAAAENPDRIAVRIGFDEGLAHRIEAGCDLFLMPSRFEPCGLNQLYSLRYGCVPLVREVGGLADSVVDAGAHATANGFSFQDPTPEALVETIDRALAVYRDTKRWRSLQIAGMSRDWSWRQAAGQYVALYQSVVRSGG